jgi:copper chaperone
MMELEIEGMTCDHCVRAVTEALRLVPGVTQVAVTLNPGKARIEGQPEAEALKSAVWEEGYRVTRVT